MSVFIKHYKASHLLSASNVKFFRFSSTAADLPLKKEDDDEEFRVLDIVKKRQRQQRRLNKRTDIQPDRSDRMAIDQKWGNVWPGPKTFHPSSVPLPLRQGYVPKGQAPPGKKANAELMKIPNFLHLTPPVVKTQCEALKQFCTPWPELLNSEEAIEKHYPVEIISSDYCHASPSIRNPLSRVVSLRVKLTDLKLDKHARDKFLRIIGDRYDETTGLVTITADRCPAKKQNYDYVNYLLTACYFESFNVEDWEGEKTEDDMEYYDFDRNASRKNLINWYLKSKNEVKSMSEEEYRDFDISQIDHAEVYKNAVSKIMNDGESDDTLRSYDEAVRKLLGLPQKASSC
ncbi:28S ribosomal protein S35, mitochondrial [Plutella xylostella]|uniref:28S ribosomal protein S35, mitochondrial n=1 Tax=Plutella xylostella TaxID=51655 RepID=UPI002032256B|nr:28S ribosomal protein S35, mitochondrial [Plutella xylostella]